LSKLPLAKILDTWGRPQGLALMAFIWTIGFVMMAACRNVQTYAAAQVFATVGYVHIYVTCIFAVAEISPLAPRVSATV
jgi:hypothetical protein